MKDMKGVDAEHSRMMRTEEQIERLRSLDGAAFDQADLETMSRHHQEAVDMSHAQVQQGTDPELKKLARDMMSKQRAEIAEMQKGQQAPR